jgi:regulator of cell morphogenesis and NO signaling
MQTATEKTVREIALENPSGIRVFESLGIDYCCGGGMALSEACGRAGVDTKRVLTLLEAAGRGNRSGAEDWTKKPLRALVAHIVGRHHGYLRTELPRIQGLLAKVVAAHGPNHPEVSDIEKTFTALAAELESHLVKEEQILFPYVEALEGGTTPSACFPTVARPISVMMAEHEDAGQALAQLRRLSSGYTAPDDACMTFVASYRALEELERDLHQHIHLENNILFPRAVELERR